MASYPTLTRPPIQEAVIDLRVKARPDFRVEELYSLRDQLRSQFVSVEDMRFAAWQFKANAEGADLKETKSEPIGLLFRTSEPVRVLQCRSDGITLSRLRPYSNFTELFNEFVTYWPRYESIVQPAGVTRIALRYINRFPVPTKAVIEDFMVGAPVAPIEDVALNGFLARAAYRFKGLPVEMNLITALEPSVDGSESSVVVDIDCFQTSGFDLSLDSLRECFERLRQIKNDVFFRSVTPKAIEAFLK